jgi:hypothetical protein
MSLALISLLALVAILVLAGFRNDLNAGIMAVAVAYGIGLSAVGLSAAEIAEYLPAQLILTIVCVALLFELANQNGTLARLTACCPYRWRELFDLPETTTASLVLQTLRQREVPVLLFLRYYQT